MNGAQPQRAVIVCRPREPGLRSILNNPFDRSLYNTHRGDQSRASIDNTDTTVTLATRACHPFHHSTGRTDTSPWLRTEDTAPRSGSTPTLDIPEAPACMRG